MIPSNFYSTWRYDETREPAVHLAVLEALGLNAESARRSRTRWIWCLVLGLLGGVLTGLVTQKPSGIVLGVFIAVFSAVFFGVQIYRASRKILDDRRRKLAVWIVRALACDVPPGGQLELKIDFNGYEQERYKEKTWPAANYTAALYRQPWLVASGKMADGTRLEFGADLVVTHKSRTKTKGRKKIKEDIHEHIHLSLRVRSLPAQAPTRWPELVRKSVMPPGAHLHTARVKKDCLLLDVRTQRQLRITNKGSVVSGKDIDSNMATRHTLLTPLLCAYQALRDCRKGL